MPTVTESPPSRLGVEQKAPTVEEVGGDDGRPLAVFRCWSMKSILLFLGRTSVFFGANHRGARHIRHMSF